MKNYNRALVRAGLAIITSALVFSCASNEALVVESYPEDYAGFLDIGGDRIHYIDYPGTELQRTPIVLVHGYSGTGFEARFLREGLGSQTRLIAPDLPGSGYSQKRDTVYTLDGYVAFLEAFLEALELERYVLVGHSMGGMIASRFASRDPSGLEALILIAPYGLPDEAGAIIEFLADTGMLVDAGMTLHNETVMRAAIRTQVFANPDRIPDDYVNYLANATFHTENALPALASITRHVVTDHLEPEELRSIDVPTLIIWGAEDRVLDFSWAARFNRAIPGSSLQAIPECGHLPHVEWPEITGEIILQFIAEL